jgi:hypothetical protein
METATDTNGSTKRLDEKIESEIRRLDEQMKLRADYSVQLSIAEAKRIDAIRAVDVQAVAVASDRAAAQALVLASQVSSSAETLRTLVAATAQTVAQQLAAVSSGINDRISALEKSTYESAGKSTGGKDLWGYIVAAIAVLVAIGSFLLPHLKS